MATTKTDQKGKKPSETQVTTGLVRFSYAHVFHPTTMQGGAGEPKYSVSILIPKADTVQVERIKKAIEAAKQAGLNAQFGGKFPANLKMPLRDGDTERPDNPEYAGHYFINASSKTKPGIVDATLNEIINESDFYSGCYGKANINFYPFNQAGSKGVACGLNHLQKIKDGEALGGRGKPEDVFEVEENQDVVGDDNLAG